jgi:protein-disulfide isomerase
MEKTNYSVPVAVIIAGLLIAGALYFGNSDVKSGFDKKEEVNTSDSVTVQVDKITPITADDFVSGNPTGTVTLVEYSDLECPFCKVFHTAMKTVTKKQPDLAWVFRHYPLETLHKKAYEEAYNAECVGILGGDEKFWQYIDQIFITTTSNDGLDLSQLSVLAEKVGIKKADLEKCLTEGTGKAGVEADVKNGQEILVTGTPFPVLIDETGKAYAIFDDGFDLETAKISDETKAIINDIFTEYQKLLRR